MKTQYNHCRARWVQQKLCGFVCRYGRCERSPPSMTTGSCEDSSPTLHHQEPVYHPATWRYSWFPRCHSQTAHPPLVGLPLHHNHKSILKRIPEVCMHSCLQRSFLTLVRHLSSEDRPELLRLCTLWVNPFFNSLQLVGPAAHVLLCLNESCQIHRLQKETSISLMENNVIF